ncbi:MAG: methyltransferase domain-containing protein [Ktedonobacteraceae bacterium]
MQTIKHVQVDSPPTVAQPWPVSIAIDFRRKRFAFFKSLIASLPRPLHILDVGGTQAFWELMGFIQDDIQLTILNTEPVKATFPNVTCIVGDARDMREFKDKEFEVVFSNAVIEHVGNFDQQHSMAAEIQRVGKRYIVQTPNRYFPIEPHVLIPFFQFFPLNLKVFTATHSPNWGWKASHLEELSTIRLMSEKELKSVFPAASVYTEKFLGLTKSFIIYKGW